MAGEEVSLRELAGQLDPVHSPTRLGGNGTPWSGERPDPETLATYDGEQYVRNAVSTAAATAYDLGMVNRTPEGVPEPLVPKGLLESHRWVEPAERDGEAGPSMREVARRHAEGTRHTLAFYNTKLSAIGRSNEARAKAMGRVLGRMGADIVGFCEVQEPFVGNPDNLLKGYRKTYPGSVANHRHSTGALYSLVGRNHPSGVGRSADVTASNFDHTNAVRRPFKGQNSEPKGWQRMDVSLDVPGVEDAGIEVYVTHLHPYNQDQDVRDRKKQYRELRDMVNHRRRNVRPEWPRLVIGDMNVHSHKEHYADMLETLAGANLQDAWLTHGGPAGDTHNADRCSPNLRARVGRQSYAPHVCDDFVSDHFGGSRIDYIFVEKPHPDHAVNVDISRMWRFAMNKENHSVGREVDDSVMDTPWDEGLSDHLAVGCELVVSPRE